MRIEVYLAIADDGRIISAHRTHAGAAEAIRQEVMDVCGETHSEAEIAEMLKDLEENGWVDAIGAIEYAGELGD